MLSPNANDPQGVPISAIVFGGRRSTTVPLVMQAFNWGHGVFLGATMGSETTAAATGQVGVVRRDPMAMLPFCGYNMGDYFAHWLRVGKATAPDKLPRIYYINWFRKTDEGRWLWPGFGENSRVLKWIFERVEGGGEAVETPTGYVPTPDALDVNGLDIDRADIEELLRVDAEGWIKDLPGIREHYARFGSRLPPELTQELERLEKRLRT